jgi:hypothetical protein
MNIIQYVRNIVVFESSDVVPLMPLKTASDARKMIL